MLKDHLMDGYVRSLKNQVTLQFVRLEVELNQQ